MNLELFIAGRLLGSRGKGNVSVPIVRIAVWGIALGLCVILLSIFITAGFKREITEKLSGFTAHLNVLPSGGDLAGPGPGLQLGDSIVQRMRGVDGVAQCYPYVIRPAILKNGEGIHGIVLKGLDSTFRTGFFGRYTVEGEFPELGGPAASREIMLSTDVASLLKVGVGDKVRAHFVQQPPRVRVFVVSGLFDTGFKEYDDMVAVCDLRHLQRLNGWEGGRYSGYGLELEELEELDACRRQVADCLPPAEDGGWYRTVSLREAAPQIFDWLNLLDMNVAVILILVMTVAGFNMVSGLLILILDKTSMIGILKALGCRDVSLRKLFLYVAGGLILKGMLAGNLMALAIGGLQYRFHIFSLDPETYYMDRVPVSLDLMSVLLVNVGVAAVSVLMLVLPTMLVSSVRPIRAIRFD